jgi:hypothetical protein
MEAIRLINSSINIAEGNMNNIFSLGQMITNNFTDQASQIDVIDRSNQIFQTIVREVRNIEPGYLQHSGSLGILDPQGCLKPEFRFPR